MSEFIKKNTALVTVLGISAVIAAVMICFVVGQYMTINEKMVGIDDAKKKIDNITNQTNPRIVKKNAQLINEDAAALEKKTREQQRAFGCYLDPALKAFMDTLKKGVAADDYKNEEFKKLVDGMTFDSLHEILVKKIAEIEKLDTNNPRVEDVKNLYDAVEKEILATAQDAEKELYKKAFDAFVAEAGKVTLEDLSNEKDAYGARYALFLQALGLPRSFENALKFAPYFSKYALNIVEKKKIPFANMEMDNNEARITNFFTGRKNINATEDPDTSSVDALTEIGQANIPHVMTRIQIYENLIKNLSKSGAKLVSVYRSGSYLQDESQDGYNTYTTELKITGTLPQIRDFANRLHQEYKNNRVYLVTYLNISTDETAPGADMAEKEGYSKEIANTMNYVKLLDEAAEAEESGEDPEQAEKNKRIVSDNWGAALIGVNDKVYAVFHINYIVYVGDQVTEAKE